MRTVIVLAMHGAPPKDFPRRELGEFFGLHARLAEAAGGEREQLARRHNELEAQMRAWLRTGENDPFHAASYEIADHLSRLTELVVVVGFNEFCAPSLDEALELAVKQNPQTVVVTTLMMTRGGSHAEQDIPNAINRARERHPEIEFDYAWPFEPAEVAHFVAKELARRA